MKNKLTILLAIIGLSAFAQDKTYPVPDYENTPFYYNAAKNELQELDVNNFTIGARPKGLYGAERAIYIEGATSSVKVSKDATTFLVKFKPGIDPRTLMDLNNPTTNAHSGKREFVIFKKGTFTSESVNNVKDISFKKVGEGLYLLTPKLPLAPGEYFFSMAANPKALYCFTVI